MNKIACVSLGCSKNLVDAENMLGLLTQEDYLIVEDEQEAEIIIVNTCSFIDSAKQESIDTILEMAEYKKSGNCKHLIITGCMAQRFKEEIFTELPEVDAVVGTGEFHKIADIIKNIPHNNKTVNCDNLNYSCENLPRIRTTPEYTAYLKISDGCSNHCTYCVIPSIRGKYRSRKIEDIVSEASFMAEEGVREILVIAQDTTNYGKDLYDEYALPKLLRELCKIDKIEWIRLHYCYPEQISDDLIQLIKSEDKICNYLDIPIQHCNNEILKSMGRRTSKEELTALLEKLKKEIPDITLRTSIITGFPGESEEQFKELVDFIEKIKFDKLGAFTYSKEEGTLAAKMENQIEEDIKQKRFEILMLKQNEISEELLNKKLGKTYKVLVEGYDNIIKNYYGRSEYDSVDIDGKIFFTSKTRLTPGTFVNVLITDNLDYDLLGEALLEDF